MVKPTSQRQKESKPITPLESYKATIPLHSFLTLSDSLIHHTLLQEFSRHALNNVKTFLSLDVDENGEGFSKSNG